jgi:hypothetical protein
VIRSAIVFVHATPSGAALASDLRVFALEAEE